MNSITRPEGTSTPASPTTPSVPVEPLRVNRVLFTLKWRLMCQILLALPVVGLFICLLTSLIFHADHINNTVCKVYNFIPSISAVTGVSPQRYLWRVAVALHISPRLLVAWVARAHYTALASHITPARRPDYLTLVSTAFYLNLVELTTLCGVTYISNKENYPVHEKLFTLFMFVSLVYMLCVIRLCSAAKDALTPRLQRSFAHKKWLFGIKLTATAGLLFFFYKHRVYCLPKAFSWFSLCEYVIATCNMLYHVSVALDFSEEHLIVGHILTLSSSSSATTPPSPSATSRNSSSVTTPTSPSSCVSAVTHSLLQQTKEECCLCPGETSEGKRSGGVADGESKQQEGERNISAGGESLMLRKGVESLDNTAEDSTSHKDALSMTSSTPEGRLHLFHHHHHHHHLRHETKGNLASHPSTAGGGGGGGSSSSCMVVVKEVLNTIHETKEPSDGVLASPPAANGPIPTVLASHPHPASSSSSSSSPSSSSSSSCSSSFDGTTLVHRKSDLSLSNHPASSSAAQTRPSTSSNTTATSSTSTTITTTSFLSSSSSAPTRSSSSPCDLYKASHAHHD